LKEHPVKMGRALFLGLLGVLAAFTTQAAGLDRVYVKNGMFYSREDDRVLLFRGINSVVKSFPWYDTKLLDPKRQEQLEDWGFNSVRLGMMWTGFEPEEGKVNETYVDIIEELMHGLGSHGVYSYLDMHQDVLDASYAGIPPWMSAKFDPPEHPYPWPMKNTDGFGTWACGYFSQRISNAFSQLYKNNKGTADYFANFWVKVAKRFKDNPSLLGYEFMNEPWTGDIYEDASLLLPGNAGTKLLEPFFNRANMALRSIDDESLVFWEPVTYAYFFNLNPSPILELVLDTYLRTNNISVFYPILTKACGELEEAGLSELDLDLKPIARILLNHNDNREETSKKPSVLGPGFTAPPGGPQYLNRTVLSWHYYCWAIGYGNSDNEFDPVMRAVCDNFLGTTVFKTVQSRAAEIGGSATFLTEFGICEPNATLVNSTGTIECNFVLDQADLHLQSWSYFDTSHGFVFWDKDTGEPILDTVRVFSRPYPQATAGTPLQLKYEHLTRMFEYTYKPDLAIHQPTEIFLSAALTYDQGYHVEVSEEATWEESHDGRKILVTANEPTESITVKISPLA